MEPKETNMLETAYRHGLANPGITPAKLADYVAKYHGTERTPRIETLARYVYENELCRNGEYCNKR